MGPRLGALFASRGLATVRDILYFFPRAYEDRSRFSKVSELKEGATATVSVTVRGVRHIPIRKFGRSMLEVPCEDETGILSLKWFHAPRGMDARFTAGSQIIVTGQVKLYQGKPQIVHPEITWGLSTTTENVGRVVPIYVELEGISSRILRKILWEALERYSFALSEDLPEPLLRAHGLPRLAEAVRFIHFPPEAGAVEDLVEFRTPAHRRLIYEEFLKFEYLVLRQRMRMQREAAPAFEAARAKTASQSLESALPFRLTGGQRAAIDEILADLAQPHPMNRLIQGDVGSGKTAVAFLSAGVVLAEGGQAALMAPTEILAEQHHKNARTLFGGKLNTALLTGKTPASERAILLARLQAGEPLLLIGTHALIEDPVVFSNLS